MSALLGAGGCSLLLDFDKDIGDAGPAGVDAFAIDEATIQASEPNDGFDAAMPLIGGDNGPLAIWPETDRDFYTIDLATMSDLIIDLIPVQKDDAADLGMALYDESQALVASDETSDDRIDRSGTQALRTGRYYLDVYAKGGQVNAYEVRVQIRTAMGAPVTAPVGAATKALAKDR